MVTCLTKRSRGNDGNLTKQSLGEDGHPTKHVAAIMVNCPNALCVAAALLSGKVLSRSLV